MCKQKYWDVQLGINHQPIAILAISSLHIQIESRSDTSINLFPAAAFIWQTSICLMGFGDWKRVEQKFQDNLENMLAK